jgi:hypothetical protein
VADVARLISEDETVVDGGSLVLGDGGPELPPLPEEETDEVEEGEPGE